MTLFQRRRRREADRLHHELEQPSPIVELTLDDLRVIRSALTIAIREWTRAGADPASVAATRVLSKITPATR